MIVPSRVGTEALRTAGEAPGNRSEDERVGIDPDDVDHYTEVIEF